jgi:serine/threonine protein kinase
MIQPSDGASHVPAGPAATLSGVEGLDLDRLVPGEVWRDRYEIKQQLPDITYGKVFVARDRASGADVLVRSFRVTDTRRSATWGLLQQCHSACWVSFVEAIEHDGRRCEVLRRAAGRTLREWAAGGKLSATNAREMVNALTKAVTALHKVGVAHLGISPDRIYVPRDTLSELVLAGFESATSQTPPGLISVNLDPFYAPPEAAGLYQHHTGPNLFAWDWWSVGRVVQELLLGQHVLGLILGRDVSRRTPELQVRAEQALREKGHAVSRPGGVELMGEIEPEVCKLLRGLLASNREGRWGSKQVEAWLMGKSAADRYELPPDERLYCWNGDALTVPEAAEALNSENFWSEAIRSVFDVNTPGSLLHFLDSDSSHRAACAKIRDLEKLGESSAFANIDPSCGREVVAALALSSLLPNGSGMRLAGRKVDAAMVGELLTPDAQPRGLSIVEGLVDRNVLQQLASLDADAARQLSEFLHVIEHATEYAQRHGWAVAADRSIKAAFWSYCLDPKGARTAIEEGRRKYAVSRDEALQGLFSSSKLEDSQAALVAITLTQPGVYRYVTHHEWNLERFQQLSRRGEMLAVAITWLELSRTLRHGLVLLGRIPIFFSVLAAAAACVALAFPSRSSLVLAIASLAAGGLLRWWAHRAAFQKLVSRIATAAPLLRLPKPAQSDALACEALGSTSAPNLAALARELAEVESAIAALPEKPSAAPFHPPASFGILRTAGLMYGLCLVATLGVLGTRVAKNPPSWSELMLAWNPPPPPAPHVAAAQNGAEAAQGGTLDNKSSATEKAKEDSKVVPPESEEQDVVKIAWPYKKPDSMPQARVISEAQGDEALQRVAMAAGEFAVRDFKPSTINGYVAVRLPNQPEHTFMLYDGEAAKLADKRVFRLAYLPMARTWLVIGGKPAIYLGDK